MAKKTRKAGKKGGHTAVPTREEILSYIQENPDQAGKRDIARAFGLRSADKPAFEAILKELRREGLFGRRRGGAALPQVTVIEIHALDEDGELLARPASWSGKGPPPLIRLAEPRQRGKGRRSPALGVGDRVLARLKRQGDHWRAESIHRLGSQQGRVLGIFTRSRGEGRIKPIRRGRARELAVDDRDTAGAEPGDLVSAEMLARGSGRFGPRHAKIIERHCRTDEPGAISLMAIHSNQLRHEFGGQVLDEAARASALTQLGKREDLRDLPLITIDPADARDHDDAVWAQADPENPKGWHIIVAIADVAHYVTPESALDEEARERGNSVYFPDRVVPMLPEQLSAGLCSLQPGEDRPCLAAHIWLDGEGKKHRHEFRHAMMRSAAGISYTQAQAAFDGNSSLAGDATSIRDSIIVPLYQAWRALAAARKKRQPLDLEVPERRVQLDKDGKVTGVAFRDRLDSHRLVEDFMIEANVAAAEALEAKGAPCMYRVHESPPADKLDALRDFLRGIGLKLAKGQVLKPSDFNQLLAQVAETPEARAVNEMVLRSQSQAFYSRRSAGHFGLNLRRYGHFTSPIRRYADVLVHRALITALDLGENGLGDADTARFEETAAHISETERRAMAAERDANDRYLASFLAAKRGAEFEGRISGVTRFGLFVTLDDTGADGLIPMDRIGEDYYRLDAKHHRLLGKHSGEVFALGDPVTVRLTEADPMSGGIRLELL